jgi:hypothetical protein
MASAHNKAFLAYGIDRQGKMAVVACPTKEDAREERDRLKMSDAVRVGVTAIPATACYLASVLGIASYTVRSFRPASPFPF